MHIIYKAIPISQYQTIMSRIFSKQSVLLTIKDVHTALNITQNKQSSRDANIHFHTSVQLTIQCTHTDSIYKVKAKM